MMTETRSERLVAADLLESNGFSDLANELRNPQLTVKAAERRMRQEYWDEVRSTAESIRDELRERIEAGEGGEPLREWLLENMHETMDGHSWVIYTNKAQRVLMHSDNSGAYVDNFGSEGLTEGGDIAWSRLAYCALEADVFQQLSADGIDVNEPDSDESREALGLAVDEDEDE